MKRIDVLDLPDESRDMIRECEARGDRTLFERNGRPVAILVSYDEYLALRETIEIANDATLFQALAAADEAATAGEVLGEVASWLATPNMRLRAARTTGNDWNALAPHEKETVAEAFATIDDDPIAGAPLFEPLKGLWTHRVGHLRIVYRLVTEGRYVLVLSIARAAPTELPGTVR